MSAPTTFMNYGGVADDLIGQDQIVAVEERSVPFAPTTGFRWAHEERGAKHQ